MSAAIPTGQRDFFATHELVPTEDNVISSIKNNKFGRNEYLGHFLNFLDCIHYSCSIAIDGPWGCGKSFFVKQAKAILECLNPQIGQSKEQLVHLGNVLSLRHSFLPIYYDAWANDNANDPFLSLIHTIATDDNVLMDEKFVEQVPFLKKLAAFVDMIRDTNIKDFYEQKDANDMLSSIKEMKTFENSVHEFLDECKPEKADRIVIFIDELDRCRPSFAVRLLESVKHYFSYDDVTFVLSINSAELEHTIKAFYGQEFNAHRYLDRFFDYRVSLPEIKTDDYLKEINVDNKLCSYTILTAVLKMYNLSIRETEKVCRALNVVAANRFAYGNPESISTLFYRLFLPIIIALKMTNTTLYREFIEGKNPKPLIDLYNYSVDVQDYFHSLTIRDRHLYLMIKDESTVEKLYKMFFSQSLDDLETFLDVINMLSPYASYY